jgi:hypothetical protein
MDDIDADTFDDEVLVDVDLDINADFDEAMPARSQVSSCILDIMLVFLYALHVTVITGLFAITRFFRIREA